MYNSNEDNEVCKVGLDRKALTTTNTQLTVYFYTPHSV